MKLQIYQFEVAEANFKQNKAKVSSLIETHYTNADIIVLPEMWNNGYALNQLKDKADIDLQQSLPFIQQLAQQYTTHIVAGSVANMRTNAIYNTAFAVSKDKTLLNGTDKIHLVPMLDEPFYLSPGLNQPNNFSINGIQASQIICYDLRYPEVARASIKNGAEMLFVVAQWTTQNLHHWRILLQARAIENNCFVIACNSVGNVNHQHHKGNSYAGHSMVVNPNGEILVEAGHSEMVFEIDIQTNAVTKQRKAIPVLEDI